MEQKPPAGFNGYRYYVLFILTVTLMFSVADRLVFSILMEDIKAEFTMSDTQIGLLAGLAFSVTYVVFGFVAARMADRSNRKNIVAGAIAFWSIMTAACGLAVGYWSLFLARVGVGMGEAASGPASQSLIADYFHRNELARAMGILTLGATVGTACGLVAGGLLAEAFGWRMAFVLFGLPGVLIGLVIIFTVREPIRGRYAPKGVSVKQTPIGETLNSLLRNKVYLGVAAGYAINIVIGYALAIWMPAIMLRNFEISTGEVAVYLGLTFLLGGIPGPIIGGYLADYLSRFDERWRAWLPGIVSALCLIPLWFSLNAGAFWPFLGLFALAYGIYVSSQGPILAMMQSSVEPSQRGFAVAFALFFNNVIGQAGGAFLIGYFSDAFSIEYGAYSLNISVMMISAVAGIIALGIFLWTAKQMRDPAYVAKMATD